MESMFGGVFGPDDAVTRFKMERRGDELVIEFGDTERPAVAPMFVRELRHVLQYHYDIPEPAGGWVKPEDMPEREREKLRPVAETLAMLDGNAFFGMETGRDCPWWWSYLPEAKALYESNGGDEGWAGGASFGPRPHPL